MTKIIVVELVEHDSWSGVSTSERSFKRLCDANRYINKTNGENTLPSAPECYWTVRLKEGYYINGKTGKTTFWLAGKKMQRLPYGHYN